MSIARVLPGPTPDIIAPLSVEQAYADALAHLLADNPDLFDAGRESDPLHKLLMVGAWHYQMAVARMNDAVRAVMPHLAHAADLDAIALRAAVARQVLDPGDATAVPPRAPVYESDNRLLQRYYGAWDRLGQSGSDGLYRALALEVPGVRDVWIDSPEPCEIVVTVLGWDGVPDAATLDAVQAITTDRDRRTHGDRVSVQAATVVDVPVTARLVLAPNADAATACAAAGQRLSAYTAWVEIPGLTPLGRRWTAGALVGACIVDGVLDATVTPEAVACPPGTALRAVSITALPDDV
ncbi:baseplate J/gp47 family protein [Insolitispirillum peregrinum]|uniref:Phage-related baseplate assembly protein n=1 Tax=Insolitispirillum peregrinum TaxID=80876 RepID=A0A1N7LRY2_9PROT|nr:baseplate J/gp47 family protein [Insolitispirillum peregrinum]SIS76451.1 Phage-related baseplate assembly protein [Insolitispirillum peregrinum]